MIYGIGTDICDVRRIRASLEKHGERFALKVLADLELWQRAGMTYWPHPPAEMDMQFTAEYQAGLARYRQLRGGQAMQQTAARYPDMPGK